MLRHIHFNTRNIVGAASSSFSAIGLTSFRGVSSFAPRAPSEKTTILLRKLPIQSTDSSLREALKEVKFRKMEIEPGCLIHVMNEAEALFSQDLLKSKFGATVSFSSKPLLTFVLFLTPHALSLILIFMTMCFYMFQSHLATTTMPSLVLQNLPGTVSAEQLQKAFSKFDPKFIQLIGGSSFQVIINEFCCFVVVDNWLLFVACVAFSI